MNIVIIASIPYTFPLYQRIHHFTELFLKDGNRVLFIEPTRFTKNQKPKENLEVWYPRVAGAGIFYWLRDKKYEWESTYRGMYRFFQVVRAVGGFRLYHQVRERFERKAHRISQRRSFDDQMSIKLLEYSESKRKIAFFQFPHQMKYLPYMKELGYKIVYDMVDDIAEFEEVSSKIRKKEIKLLEAADLVTVTSKPLRKIARKYNRKVLFLPNGVEYDHFVKARKRCRRPKDMPSGKPIVGYYGAIWSWFDDELLLYLAKERPQYDFVLIGTLLEKLRGKFKNVKNIHYLGEKKYSQLPSYLHYFDVAIIPFKKNKLTRSINPVKVYEYLAGGKPVVYTGLSHMEGFPCVYTGDKGTGFLKNIDLTLKKECNLRKVDYFIRKNDWDNRYMELKKQIGRVCVHQ